MSLSTKNNLFPNISLNQFNLTPIRGMVAFGQTPNIISVSIDPEDARTYYVGDIVKLNTTSTLKKGVIVEKSTTTALAFGIVLYNIKTDRFSHETGQSTFQVCFPNTPIYMEMAGVVTRGDYLSIDIDADGIMRLKKSVAGEQFIALALEPSSAAGDIIPVSFIL